MQSTQTTAAPPAPPSGDGENHKPAHDPSHEGVDIHDLPRIGPLAIVIVAIAIVAIFAALFVPAFLRRDHRLAALSRETTADQSQILVVDVAQPHRLEHLLDVSLPGDVRAWQSTSIYPRANGYLQQLLVDIGDKVEAGQLLAKIDTPEVDAQLAQAKASLDLADANQTKAQNDYDLADSTLKRYEGFAKTGGITQQQLDERRSAFTTAKSALAAAVASVAQAQANVQQLSAMQGFEKVIAPFPGVITARNYDLGALLSPTQIGPGKELFSIARTDTLRVFVNVPQNYVTQIKTGQQAFLSVRNYAGREFAGTITRDAGAIDPATRTLAYEVDVPNNDSALFAGMYGQVRLPISQGQPPLVVPTSALVFGPDGTRVATVGDGKIHFKTISIGRDLGTSLEVASGLTGDEQIVTNPGERLAEGVSVQANVTPAAPAPPTQQRAAAQ